MDSATFDRLARTVATTATRRGVGRALLALGLAALQQGGAEAKRRNPRRGRGPGDESRAPKSRTDRGRVFAAESPLEIDYFALGDSIAAGHGLSDEGNGSGKWCAPDGSTCCRRSPQSYPYKLRAWLDGHGFTVNTFRHLACSGATTGDLHDQIDEVLGYLDTIEARLPMLVTVCIGGNDTGMTNPFSAVPVMYVLDPVLFEAYIQVQLRAIANGIEGELKRLLERSEVSVAVNELINPLNRKSVFFKSVLDDGTLCAGQSCWSRSERIVNDLNSLLAERVASLAEQYDGRVTLTQGLKSEFGKHWGMPGVRNGTTVEECRGKGKKRKCTTKKADREECGYDPIPSSGTWISSRTDRRFNSRPWGVSRADNPLTLSFWSQRLTEAAMGSYKDWYGDCVHPNEAGQGAIAEFLGRAVEGLAFNRDPCLSKDCRSLTDECNSGTCRDGTCVAEPKPDRTSCGNDGEICRGGACVPALVHDDTFNGSQIDSSRWSLYQQVCGATMSLANGRLEVAFRPDTVGTCVSGLVSTCSLRGDFDMRVDYHLLQWPSLNGIRIALAANFPGRPAVERTSRAGQEVYLTDFDDGIQGIIPTADRAGAFRLVRSGSTVTGYYRDDNDWIEVHRGPVTTADVRYDLRVWTQANEFSRQAVSIAFDNFAIETGQLLCPDDGPVSTPSWDTSFATSGKRWCGSPGSGTGTWVDTASPHQSCNRVTQAPPYGLLSTTENQMQLSAPASRAFPYIWSGAPTTPAPFPGTGNFTLAVRMRYDAIAHSGAGLIARAWTSAEPTNNNSPIGPGVIFTIWADRASGLHTTLLGQTVSVVGNSTDFHDYRLEYDDGVYWLFVDGSIQGNPIANAARPDALWLGNPVFPYWDNAANDWSDFTVASIDILGSARLTEASGQKLGKRRKRGPDRMRASKRRKDGRDR